MCFMYSYSISQDISKVFFIVKYPAYAFVAQMLYFYFQKKKKKDFSQLWNISVLASLIQYQLDSSNRNQRQIYPKTQWH